VSMSKKGNLNFPVPRLISSGAPIFQRMTIIIQSMSFRLLSKSTPIQTVRDFKGFAEVAGTFVGLLPNSKVRAPHY